MDNKLTSPAKERKLHKQATSGGGEDLFNAKSSTRTIKQRSQVSQQFSVKPRISFSAEIEQSQHIKERTRALYLQRFQGKLDTNNRIIPTELPSNAYHGTRRAAVNMDFGGSLESLKEGQLTESDSAVPNPHTRSISIFPAGDVRSFPPRRPNTGCWKLGLRQYEKSSRNASVAGLESEHGSFGSLQGDDSIADDASAHSIGSLSTASKAASGSMKAVKKLKRQDSEDSSKLRPSGSAAKLNIFLHAQYATADLPALTRDQKNNYFGEKGTENFFKTYRELKSRGEVLLDGYADLERLVAKPAEKNEMLRAMQELQQLGVLTPRAPRNDDTGFGFSDDEGSVGGGSPGTFSGRHTPNVAKGDKSFAKSMGVLPLMLGTFEHPTYVGNDPTKMNQETLSMVVEAFQDSLTHEEGSHSVANSARDAAASAVEYDSFRTAPPTAAEIAREKERLERVAREKLAELTKHGVFVPVDKKAQVKRSKTNPDMRSAAKATRLETMPLVPLNQQLLGGKGSTNSQSLPAIKGAIATEAKTPKAGGQSKPPNAKDAKDAKKRPDSRGEKSGRNSPVSPLQMGEIVRTFSDEQIGFEPDESSDHEDEAYRSDSVFSATPFSGKFHPPHITGNITGRREPVDVTIDMLALRKRLDEPIDDPAMESTYAPESPRAIFLAGCLQASIPPVTVALIRKRITSTVNLAHMGLGTKIAKVLAPCLSALPYLQLLNLSDNHLDDEGLSVLLRAISKHKSIEILDISQNVIGQEAAEALAVFLGRRDCHLQCLRMSNANIDDGECANFVEVLMSNHHLKELDMSNNLLGKDENLNAVQPDFVTGGESLSELLSNPNCPLQTLNLHWNMIRLEGAEVLCNSLRTNRVLTNLDLSYNALGSAAAGVLGAALMENSVIVELNVANNGIDEFGCFTLMAGVRENASLRNLVLDGNPLGVQGGRILIKVATALGNRLSISAKNCDFSIHNSNFVFNINEPYGEFLLDMAVPYDRAVIMEILNICEIDSTIEFNKLEYCETANGSTFTPLKLVRFDSPVTEHSRHETRELRDLTAMQALNRFTWDDIFRIAQRYCSLDPEVLIKGDLEKLLKELRVLDINTVVSEIFFTLDPMEFGWVDIHEFVAYMLRRSQVATTRIYDLNHVTNLALSASPTTRYVPPTVGKIRVRTTEGFSCSEDSGLFKPISNSQCRQVLKCAENSSNPLSLIIFAIEACRMRIEEAKLMYRQVLSKTEDAIMVIAVILQRMRSTEDALRVLKHFIGTDVLRWRRLKQRLGTSLLPLIGIYSGYYHLDLTFPTDRVCLKKLIERSVKNCDERMQKKLGDTSQNGNWTCFRNEYHPDQPDARIIPKYFYPLPEKAKVEFDFINIHRPDITICRAVGDDVIVDMLLMTRLLDEDKVDWALARLAEMGSGLRKACLSNGRPMWKTETSRAIVVNETVFGIYAALPARKKSLLKSQKREATTKQSLTREPSMKKVTKVAEGHKNRSSMLERERQREAAEKQQKAAAAINKSVNIESFRSFNLKGKDHQMKAFWSKRLFEVMFESNGTDELKSAAVLEFFEIMMSTWWLYCRHLAVILEVFHIGQAAKSSVGSYRVELVVMWFDHILDVHNFEVVMMVLNAEEQAALYARIGILNLFNPCKPEGGWQLDLLRWEERQVAKMLIHLSVQEPGDNWIEPQFVFDHGFLPIPGWGLSVVWLGESGLPSKGILTLEFFSGNGANQQGCMVDRRLRAMLCSLVLVAQRDLQQEFRINKQELFASGNAEKLDESIKVNFRAMAKKSHTKAHFTLQALSELDATEVADPDEGEFAPKLMPFTRPHAVPTMFALNTQAHNLSMLYFDEKTQKIVCPYSYKDANAHLKTVNIEWSYGDSEGKQQDSWHM